MSIRKLLLKSCVFGIAGILVAASSAQALVSLEGDPSVVGTIATIDNIGPPFAPIDITNSQEQFDIVLRDMQHLQIIDDDGQFDVVVDIDLEHIDLTPGGTASDAVIFMDMFFSDENGDPIGPAIPVVDFAYPAGFTNALAGKLVIDIPGLDFLMHDFHITISSEADSQESQLIINSINSVRVTSISTSSNVGVWGPAVPEPVTGVLSLLGLGALGMATRRRAA